VSCDSEITEEQYQTMIVKRKPLRSTVVATGVIKPKVGAEVRVGSRVSGVVKQLNVHVGDVVKKGDLLARLDDVELTAQYNLAAANLEDGATTLKFARIEKDRQEKLLAERVISQQEYDLALKTFEVARARVAQAMASLDYAKAQLDYTRIAAPISGAVASVSTQEGETVAATFTAPTFLTIIDLTRLEVRAYVDETDISKVTEGQKAEFSVDTYPGVVFGGVVKAIYPKAEMIDNVVNYVAILDIVNSRGKILRPEMTTTVNILNATLEGVIAIPNKAILHKNGEDYVHVVKDGKPEERAITTGVKNKTLTQVVVGLSENETLILNK
ncbi:MAG TPA: efflux RND transporter periplasmic adaptor subunit, partial [Bacteroidota bacterium]|nr:efflux RND transporter periplasmic adaptor subunit [Bacteroidota bacterium]